MKLFVSLILLFSFISSSYAQTISGIVTDESLQPIQYANITLLEKKDSSFIAGCVTDADGKFSVTTEKADCILKVSYIGFASQYLVPSTNMNIIMSNKQTTLDEVVVKGKRPTYRMQGSELVANIQGTALSKLDDVTDVIQQLPFISGQGTSINVFGRGKPLIYINNRKMRNKNELLQIKGNMIKDIRIDMNPGARYASNVNAVIHITTLQPAGEGLGGNISASANQSDYFSHQESVNINYRHKGLDVFLNTNYSLQKNRMRSIVTYQFPFNNENVDAGIESKQNSGGEHARASAGFNYNLSKKQSFGLRYSYSPSWNNKTDMTGSNFFRYQEENSLFTSTSHLSSNTNQHLVTAYYDAQLNKNWSFQIDATFRHGERNQEQQFAEDRNAKVSNINTERESISDVMAVEAKVTTALMGGKLTWGGDFIFTKTDQNYLVSQLSDTDVPSSRNLTKQSTAYAFASYSRKLGPIWGEAGMRYEYVDFKNDVNGKRSKSSRSYGNFFPSISMSSTLGELSLSLSYKMVIEKPSYSMLYSGINFVNSFIYSEGNPSLRPTYRHKLTLMGLWKDLQLLIDYNYTKDVMELVSSIYEQRPAVYNTYQNLTGSGIGTMLVYSPKFSFWRPTWEGYFQLQHFSHLGRNYNKPTYGASWKNIFTLPRSWTISANASWNSKGYVVMDYKSADFSSTFSVTKRINNWRFSCGATDIFNIQRTKGYQEVGLLRKDYWRKSSSRGFYFRATYTFNPSKSKYKGGVAGQSEIERL